MKALRIKEETLAITVIGLTISQADYCMVSMLHPTFCVAWEACSTHSDHDSVNVVGGSVV